MGSARPNGPKKGRNPSMKTKRTNKKPDGQYMPSTEDKGKGRVELTDAALEAAVGGKGNAEICVKTNAPPRPLPIPYPTNG
jgi:hypothetical protein